MRLSDELQKREKELQKLIRLGSLTVLPLHSDFNHAIAQWQLDRNSQFWSRTTIRCLCAAIEATLFSFRKMAEDMAPLSRVEFAVQEIEILAEKRTVTKDGVVAIRPKFLPFPDSLKETFRLFAKAIGTTAAVDCGVGFSDLCATFELRNRLMHPKTPFDVQVSAKDIDRADRGIAWFNKTYVDVIAQCRRHLDKAVAKHTGRQR